MEGTNFATVMIERATKCTGTRYNSAVVSIATLNSRKRGLSPN